MCISSQAGTRFYANAVRFAVVQAHDNRDQLAFLLTRQVGVEAMARQRLSMRQFKEVLQLRLEVGLSLKLVAKVLAFRA
jgi:hypothetical protein